MLLQFELIKWCDHSKSVTITILCRYNTYHIINYVISHCPVYNEEEKQ